MTPLFSIAPWRLEQWQALLRRLLLFQIQAALGDDGRRLQLSERECRLILGTARGRTLSAKVLLPRPLGRRLLERRQRRLLRRKKPAGAARWSKLINHTARLQFEDKLTPSIPDQLWPTLALSAWRQPVFEQKLMPLLHHYWRAQVVTAWRRDQIPDFQIAVFWVALAMLPDPPGRFPRRLRRQQRALMRLRRLACSQVPLEAWAFFWDQWLLVRLMTAGSTNRLSKDYTKQLQTLPLKLILPNPPPISKPSRTRRLIAKLGGRLFKRLLPIRRYLLKLYRYLAPPAPPPISRWTHPQWRDRMPAWLIAHLMLAPPALEEEKPHV